jgi:hypothetical protein
MLVSFKYRSALFAFCALFLFTLYLSAQAGAPVLNSISPNSVRAGSTSVTLTVSGTGFNSSSIVRVNGQSIPSTFVNSATLSCLLPDAVLVSPGSLTILVFNADTASTSQPLLVTVFPAAAPIVNSSNPGGASPGATATFAVSGKNLTGATMSFSGTEITASPATGSDSDATFTISVDANAPLGVRTMSLSNPAGSTSVCGGLPCSFSLIDAGSWTLTGPFNDFRSGAAVVHLKEGGVLLAGGTNDAGAVTASAEILDPATGQWTPTGSMSLPRFNAAATLLPDGRVLVAGGRDSSSTLSSIEIYDPLNRSWAPAGFMSSQQPANAILLSDGRVLLLRPPFTQSEIFDPVQSKLYPVPDPPNTGAAGALSTPQRAAMLADGRILIHQSYSTTIYDPGKNTYSSSPEMCCTDNGGWLRLLPDGRMLFRGASTSLVGRFSQVYGFVYDPQSGTTGTSAAVASGPDTLLPNGSLLIAGGVHSLQSGSNIGPNFLIGPNILYDPSTNQDIAVTPSAGIPNPAAMILLDDGRVLALGKTSAEIYASAASNNFSPSVSAISSNTPATSADVIAIDLRGTGFLPNSRVQVGPARLVSLYLGSGRLVAFVPPALRSDLNSIGVTVVNPGPGGGSVGPLAAGVALPPPALTSMTPNSAARGTQFTAIVTGQNLQNVKSVSFGTGGVAAAVQNASAPDSLTLNVTVASDAALGMSSLTITTSSGSATLLNALVIQSATVPSTAPLPIPAVETGAIRVGYVIVTPDPGTTAPVVTETFGTVVGGFVQSQAAILPTPLTMDSSLQVDVLRTGGRSLGVAIANPGGITAAVSLTVRDEDGTSIGSPASISIPPGGQIARFLTEIFPTSTLGDAFRGSVEIQSTAPVSVIGLRFSGIQFSTVPVATKNPAPVPLLTGTGGTIGGPNAVMFSQFALGGGWASSVSLVNDTSTTLSGRIDIFDPSGVPMSANLNGATRTTFSYSIRPNGAFTVAPRDVNGQSPF